MAEKKETVVITLRDAKRYSNLLTDYIEELDFNLSRASPYSDMPLDNRDWIELYGESYEKVFDKALEARNMRLALNLLIDEADNKSGIDLKTRERDSLKEELIKTKELLKRVVSMPKGNILNIPADKYKVLEKYLTTTLFETETFIENKQIETQVEIEKSFKEYLNNLFNYKN